MPKRTKISDDPGPIVPHLPEPPDAPTRLLLVEKLGGHTTAVGFLPPDLHPGLDELRGELLRLRGQAVAILEERSALLAGYTAEDKAHAKALEQAARDGARTPEDTRTAPERRAAKLAAVEERVWATVRVMAEVADRVIAFVREHEDELLGDLRMRLEPARKKREEAQRLLAEAEASAWQAHRTGSWIQALADDGAMSRQPAPALVPPPPQFSPHLLAESLERPWHKRREWSRTKAAA